jgi:hypothetical protein
MQTEAAAQLARWGISPALAQQAGLFYSQNAAELIADLPARPAIVIPYFTPKGELLRIGDAPFARFRWLDDGGPVKGFAKAKAVRYGQPPATGVQVYFPPTINWAAVADDPTIPVVVTEGEAKALTACANGFTCLALGGVYNFTSANGELVGVLETFKWDARPVVIIFDSDAATNPDVLAAEARLIEELQTKRRARCRVVRLPAEGDDKVGLDDFIHKFGAEALEKLVANSSDLSSLDAKILALNKNLAWVEQEAAVYDRSTGLFIKTGALIKGSQYSSITHISPGGPKSGPRVISVAERWLTHPHAQRYSDVLFRPGEGETLQGEHGRALNLWRGWNAEPGSVEPWLRLNEYLFQRLHPTLRDIPMKTAIYKAQNPKAKIPMALILLGTQGSGKTMWADAIRDAFAPYGENIKPTQVISEYQGFLEKSVIVTIHEMDPERMVKGIEVLKALVTDLRRPMNEKYRVARQVDSYAFYIFTSNLHGVGAVAGDDRRFFVIPCPGAGPRKLYDDMLRWTAAGGPKHLMHWMLNYDLKGWKPPERAPMTSEKHMAYRESLTPVQLLAEEMLRANRHIIIQWLDAAWSWANVEELGSNSASAARARVVKASIRQFQVRPWYSPEELALMHPAILSNVYNTRARGDLTPGQLSRELRDAGVPYLVNRDDPTGFRYNGFQRQFLIVAEQDEWANPAGITQADFDRLMRTWPTYMEAKK